jgi:hypothetical protein
MIVAAVSIIIIMIIGNVQRTAIVKVEKIMIEIAILMIVDSVYAVVMSGEGRGDGLYQKVIYIIDKNINPII